MSNDSLTQEEAQALSVRRRVMRTSSQQEKIKAAEIVLPEKYIKKHRVMYRASQVEYSVPCFTGYDVKVGQRFAMLYPIPEFIIDPQFSVIPEARFYPGTVIEVLFLSDDEYVMKFKFDGGPGGTEFIMCDVKEYLRYCIPIPKACQETIQQTRANVLQEYKKSLAQKVCSKYTRPEGVIGGPCLKCGASQPEHVNPDKTIKTKKRKKK